MKRLFQRFVGVASGLAFPAVAAEAGTTAPAAPASGVSVGNLLEVAAGLMLVLAAIAGAAWLLRRLAINPGGANSAIRIIGGAAVGQRERVVLVEVSGTWLVVGVAPGHVSPLHAMLKPETHAPQPQSAAASENRFSAWLKQTIERRRHG